MTAIQGTNIADAVVPFTTEDIYPTHRALYGEGGWRTVLTSEDRDNIPEGRKEEGMVVWVADELGAYILIDGEWQDFKGLIVPAFATTETVSCFFPGSPPINSVLIWTAGLDVNFGRTLTGKGNVTNNPTGTFIITIYDIAGAIVGVINVNNTGAFTFTSLLTTDLIVRAGDILRFVVSGTDTTVRNVSFTITGQRVSLS